MIHLHYPKIHRDVLFSESAFLAYRNQVFFFCEKRAVRIQRVAFSRASNPSSLEIDATQLIKVFENRLYRNI